MNSPRPIPFLFKFSLFSIVPKSLKSFFWFSGLIPRPLSQTVILIYCFVWALRIYGLIISTIIFINPPFLVYFRAFVYKFKKICWSLLQSVWISKFGSSLNNSCLYSIFTLTPFFSAVNSYIWITSSIASLRLNYVTSFFTFSALINWKSSMS
jgi:hypothetical protein